jgi:hypothetical protein
VHYGLRDEDLSYNHKIEYMVDSSEGEESVGEDVINE